MYYSLDLRDDGLYLPLVQFWGKRDRLLPGIRVAEKAWLAAEGGGDCGWVAPDVLGARSSLFRACSHSHSHSHLHMNFHFHSRLVFCL